MQLSATNQNNNVRNLPISFSKRQKAGMFLISALTLAMASITPGLGDLANQPVSINLVSTATDTISPLFPLDPFSPADFVNSSDVFTLPDNSIVPDEDVKANEKSGEQDWQKYFVQSGDSLSTIFNKMSIPMEQMYALMDNSEAKILNKIYPGQQIDFFLDSESNLKELIVKKDIAQSVIFTASSDKFTSRVDIIESSWSPKTIAGSINGSFYVSAKKAGLSASQIQRMVNLFQFQVDFSRDLKSGDSFKAIVSREYIKGMGTGKSELRAAQLTTKGRTISLFRHDDGKFYDEQGNSLERGFLRSPLLYNARISSRFNPGRKHPITGKYQNHHGTDYAVPTGTTVVAPSDGTVIKVTRHHLAGNYIVIRHGRQYTTRYLHLSKPLVKQGQSVKRGQKIALSGNTGRSTGPHLHYELHVNNKPVNSLNAKLPMAEGLKGSDKKKFLISANKYRAEMKIMASAETRYANNTGANTTQGNMK